MTIHAIYEDGVFRPVEPVELPEHCEVVFDPVIVPKKKDRDQFQRVVEILGRRHETGISDLAARHDEHQP